MIFVTVGTQLPFDRLINSVSKAIDELKLDIKCVAQAGPTNKTWANIEKLGSLTASEFSEYIEKSDLVIGHAGMGTIIECASLGKTLIIFPRLSEYGEHRNDHQIDTASKFSDMENITVTLDLQELITSIKNHIGTPNVQSKILPKGNELGKFISNCII